MFGYSYLYRVILELKNTVCAVPQQTVKSTNPTMKMENVTKMLGMVATIALGIIVADMVKTKLLK